MRSMESSTVLLCMVIGAWSASQGARAATTTEECAALVPMEDRRRGKGAFFSGCTSRSTTTGRGGCWSSLLDEQRGCQTCIVQDPGGSSFTDWTNSIFSRLFDFELDECPLLVADLYGMPEGGLVTLEEVLSDRCPNGWVLHNSSCYFKSSYLAVATDWADADTRCGESEARLVSLESEDEDNFVTWTLLWPGFFGEAYTGLRKFWGGGAWKWSDSLEGFAPDEFNASTSYQNWGENQNASSSYASNGPSCMEITPYSPKTWNAFSCGVNKQYVCERPLDDDGDIVVTVAPSTAPPDAPTRTPPPTETSRTPTPAPVAMAPDSSLTTPTESPSVPSRASDCIPANSSITCAQGRGCCDGLSCSRDAAVCVRDTPLPTEWPSAPSTTSSTTSALVSPTSAPTAAPSGGPTQVAPTVDERCSRGLSAADKSYLELYDMGIVVDPDCRETRAGGPAMCNSFGAGQYCKSCWWSCEGARSFLEDFSWLPQESIDFCPGVGLQDFEKACSGAAAGRNLRGSLWSFLSKRASSPVVPAF